MSVRGRHGAVSAHIGAALRQLIADFGDEQLKIA
jgi:hypothetical protein